MTAAGPESAGDGTTGDGAAALRGVDRLIELMDRLRSPGGCPWDAEQTHRSLAPYAIEEAYEVAEAAELGDMGKLRDELGDLLLQVVFHARVSQELGDGFTVAEVAETIADKLVRRHPHVFVEQPATTSAAQVHARWESIKSAEPGRASVLDGIPQQLPALARAQKVIRRAGRLLPPDAVGAETPTASIGQRLLAIAAEAEAAGVQAEQELRAAVRELETTVLDAERRAGGAGGAGGVGSARVAGDPGAAPAGPSMP